MKCFKKISALIISLTMIMSCAFSTVGFAAAGFTDVADDNQFVAAISELVNKGVINGYEDGTFKPEGEITRAEFAKVIAVASAPAGYVFGAAAPSFTDTPVGNWAVPYIEYAVSAKIVNGMGDGTFAPNSPVTYEQAVKMVVCALGYGNVIGAPAEGTPWYQPYIETAVRINLTHNAFGVTGANATRGLVAQLIYNMINTKPLVQTGVDATGNPVYSQSDSSLENAEKMTGQLIAVYETTLSGTTERLGVDEIKITDGDDDEVFLMGKFKADDLKELLGYEVEITYSEDNSGDYVLESIKKSSKAKTYVVEDIDISEIEEDYIEFYDDDAKGGVDKLKYNSELVVIKNGGRADTDNLAEALGIDCGDITFIDNGGNGVMDVAFVKNYETYFVNSVTKSSGKYTIYDKFDSSRKIVLDENTQDITVKLAANGSSGKLTESTLSSITASTVLSVAVSASDEDVVEVIVSKMTASGSSSTSEVEKISGDVITFGSKKVDVGPYYKAIEDLETQQLSIGDLCAAYLDFKGKLVAVSKKETATNYGYITRAGSESSSMDSEQFFVRMYDSSGKYYSMLPVADKGFKINGSSADPADLQDAVEEAADLINAYKDDAKIINAEQAVPVKYELSGGALKSIYLVSDSDSDGISCMHISEDDDTLIYRSSSNSFRSGSSAVFTITSSTKVIIVPLDRDDDGYRVTTGTSYFTDGLPYMIDAFDATGTSPAKLVVVYGVSNTIKATENIVLVKELEEELVNSERVLNLSYYKPGSEEVHTVTVADDSIFDDVENGDIIRMLLVNGEVEKIHHLFNAADKELITDNEVNIEDGLIYGVDSNGQYRLSQTLAGSTFKAMYGTVTSKPVNENGEVTGIIHISTDEDIDEDSVGEPYTISSSTKIMKYDEDLDALYEFGVSESEFADINPDPEAATKVFATFKDNTLMNLIIFE